MEYKRLYEQLSGVAEEIRQGAFEPKPVQDTGIMRRAKKIAEQPPKRRPERTVANYFAEVNNPENTMPEWNEARSELLGISGGAANFTLGSPVKGPVGAAREALAQVESGGNYSAVGPVVKKGMYKGQRAYGRYQVMEANIGPWTEKALGKRMTTQEFLDNPQAQDRVVEWQLQQNYNKYGTWEDAASVWFSGRPIAKAGNASDGYNTVPEYISKFQNAYNNLTQKSLVKPRKRDI